MDHERPNQQSHNLQPFFSSLNIALRNREEKLAVADDYTVSSEMEQRRFVKFSSTSDTAYYWDLASSAFVIEEGPPCLHTATRTTDFYFSKLGTVADVLVVTLPVVSVGRIIPDVIR